MTDARIGRILAACLHEAIGEVIPERLEFYEEWLRSEGLRDGSIGLGPITAVLGFLRTEEAYGDVMTCAGRLAADWTVADVPAFKRRLAAWLPPAWRLRVAVRMTAEIIRNVYSMSRASTQVGRGDARLDVNDSLFCGVRDHQTTPLCGFYAAAAVQTFAAFGLPARARVDQCRAVDGGTCVIAIDVSGSAANQSAMAA